MAEAAAAAAGPTTERVDGAEEASTQGREMAAATAAASEVGAKRAAGEGTRGSPRLAAAAAEAVQTRAVRGSAAHGPPAMAHRAPPRFRSPRSLRAVPHHLNRCRPATSWTGGDWEGAAPVVDEGGGEEAEEAAGGVAGGAETGVDEVEGAATVVVGEGAKG